MSESVFCERAYRDPVRRGVLPGAVLLLMSSLICPAAFAQPQQNPPVVAPQPSAPQATAKMSPQQLDDLVAPIALYPDPLIAQVFAASTYPMELAEAQQWVRDHPKWKPSKLMDKAKKQKWDPSVQGLVAFPEVLTQLTQNMTWTTQLGNAFLAQQPDVMQAVQRMRQQAEANGKLHSTPQVTVSNQDVGGQQEITIQPANPEVWYVPSYNPAYVWGPPMWGAYPSLWYPGVDLGFGWYPGIDMGLYFGGWDGWGWGGWGWGPNWYAGTIFVNRPFFNRYGFRNFAAGRLPGNSVWMHNPEHRFGVPYANPEVARRFALNGRGAAGRVGVARGFDRFAQPGSASRGFANNRSVFGGGVSRAPRARGFSGMGAGRSFGGTRGGFGGGMRGGFGGGMRGGFGGGMRGGGRR